MLKQLLLTSTALFLISGCVTKEIVYQPVSSMVEIESHTFAGETLTATPKVSQLVKEIKNLETNTAYIDLNSNQNVRVGDFLNISATPNQRGYLKLIIIDPNGEKKLVLPNSISQGYLEANKRFSTNNEAFALKSTKPRGLHYVVVVFSEQNVNMVMQERDFTETLQRIKNQEYGRSHISIFPMRIY